MTRIRLATMAVGAGFGLGALPGAAAAQGVGVWAHLSSHAVFAASHVDPVPGGGAASELRVVEPLVMLGAGAFGSHLALHGALDLEGLTMPGGVLSLGAWGEGFDDRRHPHTYLHELVLSLQSGIGRHAAVSLSAGKGFVPFGSDDPMNRAALRFPVNHHWSQILERAVLIAGGTIGPAVAEASLFNGDEPERPGQWPRIGGRFGDSWSLRVTVSPADGVALSASHAKVHSPENRPGAATDQQKWHLSARVERGLGGGYLLAMAEWARTTEAEGFFRFSSALAEAQWSRGTHRVYYQFERTDRPEEERTTDPFRSLRPHLENSILGTTRWTVQTVGYGVRASALRRRLTVEPLVEGSFARVAKVGGGLFDPAGFYGKRSLWSLTVGVRLATGGHHRMGRYGVSAEPAAMASMTGGTGS